MFFTIVVRFIMIRSIAVPAFGFSIPVGDSGTFTLKMVDFYKKRAKKHGPFPNHLLKIHLLYTFFQQFRHLRVNRIVLLHIGNDIFLVFHLLR